MSARGERSTARVLYVDPDEERAAAGVGALAQVFAVERVSGPQQVRARLAEDPPDCIVTEQELDEESELDLLRDVHQRDGPPVVVFTDDGDERLAADAISAGVADYVLREPVGKPTVRRPRSRQPSSAASSNGPATRRVRTWRRRWTSAARRSTSTSGPHSARSSKSCTDESPAGASGRGD